MLGDGYDKSAVVVAVIVEDICGTVARYYRRAGDLEPGQLIYNAPAASVRAGRGKTIAKIKLVPVRLTIVADEGLPEVTPDGCSISPRPPCAGPRPADAGRGSSRSR